MTAPIGVRPLRRGEKTLWATRAAHAWNDEGCDVVVVDEFPSDLSACDEIEERAKVLVGLRHPNLATVRDVVRTSTSCSVVVDFVEGERLDVLRDSGKLGPEIALRIVVDALHALGALHDRGERVVHGHVEPSNVIVGEDGVARLVRGYLGPSTFIVIEASAMHRVAPEVMREHDIGQRADVYGVGVLMKELLPEELPKWAAGLAGVAATALAPDPALRFATTADMARELRLVAKSHVAAQSKVASFVRSVAGERIDARRIELLPPTDRPVVALIPPSASEPHAAPTAQIVFTPRPAGRTTRMLRASLVRMSRLWALTVGVTIALAATLAWVAVHASHPATPAPIATVAPPPEAPPAESSAPAQIELPDTVEPSATTTSTTGAQPHAAPQHHAPRRRVDRSAVF